MKLFKRKKVKVDDIVFAIYREKNGVGVLFDQKDINTLITSLAALAYQNPTFSFVLKTSVKALEEKGPILKNMFGLEEPAEKKEEEDKQ